MIAKIVGKNVINNDAFDNEVPMYVYEEMVDGKKLTEIINKEHENVKYLPGRKLPENVIAVPDIVKAAEDSDIVIFVIPHQFLGKSLAPLKGKIKKDAIGVSLIKGMEIMPSGGVDLISNSIRKLLGIPVSVLMGANLAHEVADGQFCETTIGVNGIDPSKEGKVLKQLFQTPNFCVKVVEDAHTV